MLEALPAQTDGFTNNLLVATQYRHRLSAEIAGPSTALRSGRDDKGRTAAFRKGGDLDGRNLERLARSWLKKFQPAKS